MLIEIAIIVIIMVVEPFHLYRNTYVSFTINIHVL